MENADTFMTTMNVTPNQPKTKAALLVTALMAPVLSSGALFPNGDFSEGGSSWIDASGGGTFVFDFPDSNGNPGGFALIDHTANDGGFGVLVSGGGDVLSLASLGLTAGESYRFTQDMILLSGPRIGGIKFEFYVGNDPLPGAFTTGDIFPDPINDGTTWETYEFLVTVPNGADGMKVVPLWGEGSTVGFDNIGFDETPLPLGSIPNAQFEFGNFAWFERGSIETTWSYPETGGNPGSHAVMTNTGIGFGTLVANNDQVIPLADLGLANGDTAAFQQDMIILSGENVGGLRIDFFNGDDPAGTSGDMDPAVIGDGSTWETYTFPVMIPEGVDGLKIFALEGLGSSVGYDNFDVNSISVPPIPNIETTLEGRFVEGTLVSWAPQNPGRIYQPQRSFDGVNWTDFGPAYPGTETTSLLDPLSAPSYRIREEAPAGLDSLVNGSFETEEFNDPSCAENWSCLSPSQQPPTRSNLQAFSGEFSMRIAVANDTSGSPNQAEIQQNLVTSGGFVTPGETYTFSFRAYQVSSGPSYVQQYRLRWFDALEEPIPGADVGFNNFVGGDNEWAEVSVSGLVAPPNAAGVFIQIFGATGAIPSIDARGEVFIDDVKLTQGESPEPVFLETTQAPGVGIYALTLPGQSYRARFGDDLENLVDLSGVFIGNGEPVGAGTPMVGPRRFFSLQNLPDVGQ